MNQVSGTNVYTPSLPVVLDSHDYLTADIQLFGVVYILSSRMEIYPRYISPSVLVTVDVISCEYVWGADIGVVFACPRQRVMGIVLSQSNGSMTGIYIYWNYLTDYISERRDE